ncbi:DNA/RNA helicase [Staphylococcus felis]|uniref:DEAD/DEAH box helicase family protein n=1 Tax=Staphylococcus felis TaxID=46127 RepID=A0AAX1RWY9_9STAP|nr:DEAD/DEAH box helicase family protein [Staphylococcus felis]MBH9580311.1 DEAD/DEAH box helicase family protein [Staphylococcus felis]MDM8328359.1 DEAD/DEAH box helicase family protein [Staphylococcus felis]MDQ7192504.1 DEAD/DEAH box helicase family protein [Staphylococcus felis]REH75864.1 DNA/RNA helicase [Staphylococcus felis]REH81604.1 DNA/RNA helicase [Staphylococcus felis]
MSEGGTSIKYYGQVINDVDQRTDEIIATECLGVTETSYGYHCTRCEIDAKRAFYRYYSQVLHQDVVYCRNCINMGRMDNISKCIVTQSHTVISQGNYELPFVLSEQQQYASDKVVRAVLSQTSLLLHAVTGAGKTEMMFEAISQARKLGYNIAVVSPRVDVVVEVSERIISTFKDEAIDVLHQASPQRFDGHFVVSTVHQLYRFKNHFHVVFIDEVDAFPLSMDPQLMNAISKASRDKSSHIYMTATPPSRLKSQFSASNTVILPARFHRNKLVVPKFKFYKVKHHQIQNQLLRQLKNQQSHQRTTLLFFNHIQQMLIFYKTYQSVVKGMCCIYSEDPDRLEKVAALRERKYSIVLTTTILERGFTMSHLDVWVMDSHTYTSSALIQIAGRVGRKAEDPTGTVIYFHEGRTVAMYQARHEIFKMNNLALKRGWIDH